MCHIKFKNSKYLFALISAVNMYAVGYDVYQHPQLLLIGLRSIGCRCKLIHFNKYNLRVYIHFRIFCGHILVCTAFPRCALTSHC
jgi:hypothetical protein